MSEKPVITRLAKALLVAIGFILTVGCAKKKQPAPLITAPELQSAATEEDLCASTGIRFPVDFSLYSPLIPTPGISSETSSDYLRKMRCMVYAEGRLKVPEVVRYYQYTLAADGWFVRNLSHTCEGLLYAKRGRQRIYIVIRPHDGLPERTLIRYLVYKAPRMC